MESSHLACPFTSSLSDAIFVFLNCVRQQETKVNRTQELEGDPVLSLREFCCILVAAKGTGLDCQIIARLLGREARTGVVGRKTGSRKQPFLGQRHFLEMKTND